MTTTAKRIISAAEADSYKHELCVYTDNIEKTLDFNVNAQNCGLLLMQLFDSDGNIIATSMMSPDYFHNTTVKLYGSSSSQWGSFRLSDDYAKGTFNRTSANTSRIRIIGYYSKIV